MYSEDPETERWLQAASEGNIPRVVQMLESGVDVNHCASDGRTALMRAAGGGHLDLMRLLLHRGADPNATCNVHGVEYTALTHAAWRASPSDCYHRPPDPRAAELLLASGARHQLLDAVLLNRPDIARLHLDRGEDANSGEWCYHGPLLMQAAECGYLDLVELLLAYGARIEARDDISQTTLACAAERGQFEVVKLLLDRGAEMNARDVWGQTALSYAALDGQHQLVDELLARGANRGIFDALALDDLVLFRELLDQLPKTGPGGIDGISDRGQRLARFAVVRGDPDVLGIILDHGAAHRLKLEYESYRDEEYSLLSEAACQGNREVARLLIDRGADLNDIGADGLTPLARAIRCGHREVADLLRKAGASC